MVTFIWLSLFLQRCFMLTHHSYSYRTVLQLQHFELGPACYPKASPGAVSVLVDCMACLPHTSYTCKSSLASHHHLASTEGGTVEISFIFACPALVLVLSRLFHWVHSNHSVTSIGRQHTGGEGVRKGRQVLFRKI